MYALRGRPLVFLVFMPAFKSVELVRHGHATHILTHMGHTHTWHTHSTHTIVRTICCMQIKLVFGARHNKNKSSFLREMCAVFDASDALSKRTVREREEEEREREREIGAGTGAFPVGQEPKQQQGTCRFGF